MKNKIKSTMEPFISLEEVVSKTNKQKNLLRINPDEYLWNQL